MLISLEKNIRICQKEFIRICCGEHVQQVYTVMEWRLSLYLGSPVIAQLRLHEFMRFHLLRCLGMQWKKVFQMRQIKNLFGKDTKMN